MIRTAVVSLVLCLALPAVAGNAPEGAQQQVEMSYLPKLDQACGFHIDVRYDGASLKQHNKDIRYDQTGGSNECNEPLRYVWYACKTPAGKDAIKRAGVKQVVCKGTAGPTGSLTFQGGVITVERAFEEKDSFLRAKQQFDALFKIALQLGHADPYYDQEWHELSMKPNPVTSTKTYCLVNKEKVDFNEYAYDTFVHRKEDATVKCWKEGELVTDVTLKLGKKSGFVTHSRDKSWTRTIYKDDKRDGEERSFENGKLKRTTAWATDRELWSRELHPSGKLARFSKKYSDRLGGIALGDDGKVHSLTCSPEAKTDADLRKPCGFEGVSTVQIYDGTGKVSRVQSYKDGVLAKEGAGDSTYASRNEVAYKDGKKHGPERVLRKDGTLQQLTTWSSGQRDGKETFYSDDGKKVVKEIEWKAGAAKQVTELYLNGNPKERETFESDTKKRVQRYWDTGKASADGMMVMADQARYHRRDWCEDGTQKTWFENGQLESESSFKACKREGTLKRWFDNGKPSETEEYQAGTRTKAKRWDRDGKLVLDEEYEADGSRKIKR